jgi:hypothetical protein
LKLAHNLELKELSYEMQIGYKVVWVDRR